MDDVQGSYQVSNCEKYVGEFKDGKTPWTRNVNGQSTAPKQE